MVDGYDTQILRLRLDPHRADMGLKGGAETGIYVRATDDKNVPCSIDIVQLDRASLIAWLRSRGGRNVWAENVIMLIFGHTPIRDTE